MPRIIGGRHSTYLLLNGITVSRCVALSPGIDLLPVSKRMGPKPLLSGLDLLDQQFALLMLPWVDCQIRVSGEGRVDVASRAWNSLWDVLLLSAVFGVQVNCGLQSTAALEHFTERSRLNVIHYRFFNPPNDGSRQLTEVDCDWLEQHFSAAQNLLSDHGFQNAVHCLATYHWHSLPRAQLALIWAGIEGLFGVDSEITFRISLYAAKFLAPEDVEQQRAIFGDMKRLYGVRSKAVHGGKLKGDPHGSVEESVGLLGRLIRACVEQKKMPVPEQLVL